MRRIFIARLMHRGAAPATAVALAAWGAAVGLDLRSEAPIPAAGGAVFRDRMEIDMPRLRQADPQWAADPLGPTQGTIANEGCAITSAAMVLRFHGVPTDPGALNRLLLAHPKGFTPAGWIYWEAAAGATGNTVRHAYEGPARHRLVDRNLARGNPLIARLRMPSGSTHFVVIRGKEGREYLVSDPGASDALRLSDFTSPLEAVRFYLPDIPCTTHEIAR